MGRRGAVVAVLVALVATLAAASSASAASLVFVRAGDLFAVNVDGSQLRLIANGPEAFASPSVAADGTVWAINGRTIVQMAPSGAVLRVIALSLADAPVDLDLSPDGTRLAVELSGTTAPGVYVVSTADGTVAPKSYPGLVRPAWLADGQLLVHRPAAAPGGAAALVANVTAATDPQQWFVDAASLPTDGDVSADFTLGAWTNGGAGVVVRQLAGPPPAQPTGATCSYTLAAIGPVIQPNAHALAFTSDDGIWLVAQPEVGATCGDAIRVITATEVRDVAWNPLDLGPGSPPLSADGKARLSGLALAAKSFPAATRHDPRRHRELGRHRHDDRGQAEPRAAQGPLVRRVGQEGQEAAALHRAHASSAPPCSCPSSPPAPSRCRLLVRTSRAAPTSSRSR